MKIAIVTDAWSPQTNGVVTTLKHTGRCLRVFGNDVLYVTPEKFRKVSLPSYNEIKLAILPKKQVFKILDDFDPDTLHIATEGPLGWAARSWALSRSKRFTTAYHTQFPYYLRLRLPVPISWTYALLRRFHGKAARTLVPTETQKKELERWRFKNVVIWTRGVDTNLFKPASKALIDDHRPIAVYMGRVSVEKNISAFLDMNFEGSKYVIGDGPDTERLKKLYPETRFMGYKFGEDLAEHLAACDVFVFPSRTDTFGLVLLEAMACGLPVAAFPVTGPLDTVINGKTGILEDDLESATKKALELDPADARSYAENRSWEAATTQFLSHLEVPEIHQSDVNRILANYPEQSQPSAETG
ncbi:MAG: glycosyltransferase family 1 protein [Granulosicoccus sp.]|nr:glycosyltransferase family 1 protein [Granulosicoccus sp.]